MKYSMGNKIFSVVADKYSGKFKSVFIDMDSKETIDVEELEQCDTREQAEEELFNYANEHRMKSSYLVQLMNGERVIQHEPVMSSVYVPLSQSGASELSLEFINIDEKIKENEEFEKQELKEIKLSYKKEREEMEKEKAEIARQLRSGQKKVDVKTSWEKDFASGMMLMVTHEENLSETRVLKMRKMTEDEMQTGLFGDGEENKSNDVEGEPDSVSESYKSE